VTRHLQLRPLEHRMVSALLPVRYRRWRARIPTLSHNLVSKVRDRLIDRLVYCQDTLLVDFCILVVQLRP
jgi:hypothetical protein